MIEESRGGSFSVGSCINGK